MEEPEKAIRDLTNKWFGKIKLKNSQLMRTFSYCSIFIYFMVILYEPRVSGTGAWAQLH
jgi:hypothetical protein